MNLKKKLRNNSNKVKSSWYGKPDKNVGLSDSKCMWSNVLFCFVFVVAFVILFNVGHNTKVTHIYLHIQLLI